jgi:hypothetical protein
VRIGVVGFPSRSRPRTECQNVLMATPEIPASVAVESVPSIARATRSSSSSASLVAPPSGVYSKS